MKAIVVGGGIGGLATALTLHRAGVQVRVFESARELKPLGVGINLLPNAVRVLDALGLLERFLETGIQTKDLCYFNKFGQQILREPRGIEAGYRLPQISIHRGEAQFILLRAARERLGASNVVPGHHFVEFTQTDGRVAATFIDRNDGDRRVTETADLLIGADGIHSNVRRQLYPEEGGPRWSGVITWRGATEFAPLLSGRSMALSGSPKQIFMAYPMTQPESGRTLMNWAAAMPAPDPSKGFPAEDWNRVADKQAFLPSYESWKFDWLDVPALIRATETVFEFPRVDRDPLPRWTFGRVTLLGDAAHPMHPWGSSGATLAIVDAYLIADALARHAHVEEALHAYEEPQRAMTAKVVLENRAAGPVAFMKVVEERAPNGFDNLDSVISPQELAELAGRYKKVAAFDLESVNRPIEIRPRDPAWA
jgi:2-polyprenyl-6-methoxyphenol hydroxylase-like FAD-dependent oxidoreductase